MTEETNVFEEQESQAGEEEISPRHRWDSEELDVSGAVLTAEALEETLPDVDKFIEDEAILKAAELLKLETPVDPKPLESSGKPYAHYLGKKSGKHYYQWEDMRFFAEDCPDDCRMEDIPMVGSKKR